MNPKFQHRLLWFFAGVLTMVGVWLVLLPKNLKVERNVWDDSTTESVVKNIETAALAETRGLVNQTNVPYAETPASILSSGLELLNVHYAVWAKDVTIARRLGQAVLMAHPNLLGNAAAGSGPGSQNFFISMWLAGLTHDRAMIAVLRPFLADKTLDLYTSASSNMPPGVTPMRVCELAANAICGILGEPEMVSPWSRARAC